LDANLRYASAANTGMPDSEAQPEAPLAHFPADSRTRRPMRQVAVVAIVAMFGTAATAGLASAQSDADLMRELRDRAQIEDLMWRYTRALDTYDADAYAAAYTPDGEFRAGATATKGRDALKKMIADLGQRSAEAKAKGQPTAAMYHMTANERITFIDKDHARIEAYYITAFAAAGPNTPLRVAAVGRSIDDLVRVDGKWLIRTRNVAPQN
jgi:hypothetical protein